MKITFPLPCRSCKSWTNTTALGIVYSSSATVYGTPPIIPIPETTRLKADSPYGKSKIMSETIIDDLCHGKLCYSEGAITMLIGVKLIRRDGGHYHFVISSTGSLLFRHNIVSHSHCSPAGAHPSGLIGEDPRGRPGNLLPTTGPYGYRACKRIYPQSLRK